MLFATHFHLCTRYVVKSLSHLSQRKDQASSPLRVLFVQKLDFKVSKPNSLMFGLLNPGMPAHFNFGLGVESVDSFGGQQFLFFFCQFGDLALKLWLVKLN